MIGCQGLGAGGWGVGRGHGNLVFNGDRVSVEEGEEYGSWMMEGVAQQCECT